MMWKILENFKKNLEASLLCIEEKLNSENFPHDELLIRSKSFFEV